MNVCQILKNSTVTTVKIAMKQQNDPVTQVDHSIQKYIISQIHTYFPQLNIIAQETLDQEMVNLNLLNFEAEKMEKTQNMESLEKNWQVAKEIQVDISDICLYIDPLDCTRGYVAGNLWECSTLIGVVQNGEPIMGFIAQPFIKVFKNKYEYSPRIIVGGSAFGQSCAYQYFLNKWDKITKKDLNSPLVLAVSSRRSFQDRQLLVDSLKANLTLCGGSGNKLSMLIRGEVDSVLFIGCPLSSWDICAGQAILKAMGGHLTKPNRQSIEYLGKNQTQTHLSGFVASSCKNILNEILQICH